MVQNKSLDAQAANFMSDYNQISNILKNSADKSQMFEELYQKQMGGNSLIGNRSDAQDIQNSSVQNTNEY